MAKKRKAAKASKPSRAKAIAATDEPDVADMVDEAEPKADNKTETSTEAEDVHAEVLERYQSGWLKDRDNQNEGYVDLKFLSDVEDNGQWDDKAKRDRIAAGRPVLTVNKTEQFVRQITGDIRQMRPAIKVVPVDDAASDDVAAKVLPGMLRYIEQRSDAKAAYFNGVDQAAAAGIGHWRVLTEYAAGTTFNQEIGIGLIEDGIAVVWDPDSIHPTRKDAMWCFVPVDMAKKAAEKKWPGKSFAPLDNAMECFSGWYTDDHVRVAEYWRKIPCKRELALYPDGKIDDLTDDDGQGRAEATAAGAKIDFRDSYKVQRSVVSAADILEEPDDWPGVHIPIVPVIGTETKIGRRIVRRGVVRPLRDVQRLYNYAISADAEFTALQPKAPFVGTKKNFEEHVDEWENANTENLPFLRYTPDSLNGNVAPQRQHPPEASTGIHELLMTSTADMSGVTGIYPAGLGQASNETSGKAILARQREGDTGTYHYVEAFGRAVQRTGEIVVDLIPHVYDTARVIRIVGEDGKIDKLELNKPGVDDRGLPLMLNDVTVGAYEVAVEMGPSFATKREEARDGMQTIMQALGPEGAMLFVDLYVKSQDFPLADKIAKRAQLALPPQIQQLEAAEAGEQPPPMPPQAPPPPPTPKEQLDAEKAKAEHERDMLRIGIESKELELKGREIAAKFAKIDADLEEARMGHQSDMTGHAIDATHKAATGMQADEHAAADREHAAGQADLDRAAATQQAGSASPAKGKPAKGGKSAPPAPATDQRVDALVEAVGQLREIVVAMADELAKLEQGQGDQAAPGAPPPDAGAVPLTIDPAAGQAPPPSALATPGIAPPAS